MRIVVGTDSLAAPGGVRTYVVTLAEQLERLGHDAVVYAPETGVTADRARERGIRVHSALADLPEPADAVIANGRASALELAGRFPAATHVFVCHSHEVDDAMPPLVDGLTAATIVMNDRVAARARALTTAGEVVRLRQPIDILTFRPRGDGRNPPRRVLLAGNYLDGARRDVLTEACKSLGMECRQVSGRWEYVRDMADAMAGADIVVGKARVVLEAMACGRAAFVFDWTGWDGWVTPGTYPMLEADNFGGRVNPAPVDHDSVRAALTTYAPGMGLANRDLVVARHSASEHAQEVVAVLRRHKAHEPGAGDAYTELSRLARVQWQLEYRAVAAGFDVHETIELNERLLADLNENVTNLAAANADREELRSALEENVANLVAANADRDRLREELQVLRRRLEDGR